jgi:low affinity Fe/Cu permease
MEQIFTRIAGRTACLAGKPATFLLCAAVVLSWAVSGPVFGFSDTWQLVINTGTTIVTFLMVFLIQNTQNRDGIAIQAKLDELIRASRRAGDDFIGIEHLTEKEVEAFRHKLEAAAKRHAARREKKGGTADVAEAADEDGARAGGNAALAP